MQREPHDPLDVLMILGTRQLRGSFARAVSLAQHLPPRDVRLKLISTDAVDIRNAAGKEVPTLVHRSLNWPALNRLTRRWIRTDLERDPPDLIDIQHRRMLPLGIWLARKLRRPYLVTVHDYLRDRERFPINLQWCRRVIAVSESVRGELLERTRLPREMVTVIHSGVSLPPAEELSTVLLPGRAPVIGTAGPLESGKGLRHFLRAAAIVLQRHPDVTFIIAGSGPEERPLRRLVDEIGIAHAVTFLPNLHDFTPALRAMDIFVLPALKQGLGTTMLQAMAGGLPVIGTESGGVHSVISHEETGLLVPPSDCDALAAKMEELLNDPERARQLGHRARQRVADEFHFDQMLQATLALYGKSTGHALT